MLKAFTRPGPDGSDEVAKLGVEQCLVGHHAFRVENFAAKRQHGLRLVVAALLGGAAGAVALDDEQL